MRCPIIRRLLGFTVAVALSFANASGQRINGGADQIPALTSAEASDLINLLPVVRELRAKGMDVRWDLRAVPDMNNTGFSFGFTTRLRRNTVKLHRSVSETMP